MFPTELKDWIIFSVITLGFGILGTALWEILIKPFSVLIGRKILKIGTLGIKSTSDRIYQDIAARAIHRDALFILGLIGLTVFAQALDYTLKYPKIERQLQAQYKTGPWSPERIKADVNRELAKKSENELRLELNALKNDKVASIIESRESAQIIKIAGLSVVALMILFAYLRRSYLVGAIEYFDQILVICAPHIDDSEVKNYRAMFASIRNSEDFAQIIKSLQEIAEANNAKHPKFIGM